MSSEEKESQNKRGSQKSDEVYVSKREKECYVNFLYQFSVLGLLHIYNHNLNDLIQNTFIISQCPWNKNLGKSQLSCLFQGRTRLESRCWPSYIPIQRPKWGKICLQIHSDCQPHSFSCSYQTESFNFLLVVIWRSPKISYHMASNIASHLLHQAYKESLQLQCAKIKS